jgi:glycosyltransferase involved in cell wall biosynthesis
VTPLLASVVVPARDEAEHVGACLRALAGQAGVAPEAYEVLLVLDRCTDATEEMARAAAATLPKLRLGILHAPPPGGVGLARRFGMDLACERLDPDALIATTDADSQVAPDWLRVQLDAVALGARAIGGRVELDPGGAARLARGALERRRAEAADRMRAVRAQAHPEARTEHHQFSGASIGVTAATYARVGRLQPRTALEDEGFERALRRHGIAVHRLRDVRVTTSARPAGRAPRGLAVDLRRAAWQAERSFRAADFPLRRLLAAKGATTVSLVLPAREVAKTIGGVLDAVAPLREAGLIDELLVVDAASGDGTAAVAAARGAPVADESSLLAAFGPALGKGDAMWRGLAATSGEVVAFADTDTEDFTAGFVRGLLGPLLCEDGIDFVKGHFRRPLRLNGAVSPEEGGRVTELAARPLLNLHVPELAGFLQPLAGEVAARRALLESLPFPVGYGVEIGMLIDALRAVGLQKLAQVDLGTRQNRHQPLHDLSAMALAVLVAAERRILGAETVDAAAPGPLLVPVAGELRLRSVTTDERPPLAGLPGHLRPAAAAPAAGPPRR